MIKYIDTKNAKGKKLALHEMLNCLQKKHAVYRSNHTLSRAMLDIGLSYKPSKPIMCNNNVSLLDQIRDYLIYLHALIKIDKEGKAVLIYLDELYCNTTRFDTHSWHLSTDDTIRNKLTSRGRCLIFIHDIMKDCPM